MHRSTVTFYYNIILNGSRAPHSAAGQTLAKKECLVTTDRFPWNRGIQINGKGHEEET